MKDAEITIVIRIMHEHTLSVAITLHVFPYCFVSVKKEVFPLLDVPPVFGDGCGLPPHDFTN